MIDSYIKYKIAWSRAYSHISPVLTIFNSLSMLILLMKSFGLFSPITLSLAVLLLVPGMVVVGLFDMKAGIYDMEQSLMNTHNPELRRLLDK